MNTPAFKLKLTALCALLLAAFGLQPAALSQSIGAGVGDTLTATPLLPSANGTYYYNGFDSTNNHHVFIQDATIYTGTSFSDLAGYDDGTVKYVVITNGTYSLHSGTYYYVDTDGNTTIGTTADFTTSSPYRAVVAGGVGNFQVYNNHIALYTPVTNTGSTSAIDYSVRAGPWFASDITLSLETGGGNAALQIDGVSATFSTTAANATTVTGTLVNYANGTARAVYPQPVVFSGTNINIFSTAAATSDHQAVSVRNGGSVFLYGGTISKTVATGNGSETIHLLGNQEGQGSSAYFYGEDLTIISSGQATPTTGQALEAINQENGRTIVELHNSTIDATIKSANNNAQVFNLNDQQGQGGASFIGENLVINVVNEGGAAVRTFAFGYGENSITLKNSTITTGGSKGAVFRWKTSESNGANSGGAEDMADGLVSQVTLENTNVTSTADYAPIFQQTGRLGWATVTGGTLTTTGANSPILRLLGANDAHDETKFTGIFTNVLFDAQNSSAIDLDMFTRNTDYGEAGNQVNKDVATLITTAWDLVFITSTLSGATAMRVATAGEHNSPYNNDTRLSAFDSTIIGRIEMDAGASDSGRLETSGANLILQSHNSHFIGGFYMDGTETARKNHQATLDLLDSTWDGDIIGVNRGVFLAKFNNTPLTGDITISGSVTGYLDFINSPINGGVHLDGTATLVTNPGLDFDNRRATIRNSPITGGFTLDGASHLDLVFEGQETVVSGGIAADGAATGIFRFENNSSINGGVTVSGSSSVTLILSDVNQLTGDLLINDRARLALATFAGTPIHLNRSIDLAGIWGITGNTTLAGLLDVTHPLGTISINNASPDILTLDGGFTGNGRLDIASIDGNFLGDNEIRVIHDTTENFAPDALILAHPVDYGLAAYDIENRPDGAYLVGGLANGSFGTGGAAVFNSQALMVEDWLASLLPVNNRLSELRQTNAAFFSGDATGAHASGDAGAFWLQTRIDTTQVDAGGNARNFESRTIGFTVGVDARWDSATSSLSSGLFVDTARTDRDFIDAAEGSSDSVGGGLYVHYYHRKGFFASAIARFDTCETTLDTHSPNNALKADYNTQAVGVAIEIGWRLKLADTGWWYEPACQLTLATFPGVSYDTLSTKPDNNIAITTEDTRATQSLFRFAFGRTLSRKWGFHGYLAAATVDASGGEFAARYDGSLLLDRARFILAGDRVEASLGLSCQLGHAGRLTLNATYIEADSYQRPCTFSFGYSHAW